MFKVYGYVNFRLKHLGDTFNEGEVFKIIDKYYDKETAHFIIIKQLKDMMIPYRAILSDLEYEEYKQDYYKRIEKDKSTLELKRKILRK